MLQARFGSDLELIRSTWVYRPCSLTPQQAGQAVTGLASAVKQRSAKHQEPVEVTNYPMNVHAPGLSQ